MKSSGLGSVFFGSQYNVAACLCVCLSLCGGTKKLCPVWGWCQFYQYDDYMQKKGAAVVLVVPRW